MFCLVFGYVCYKMLVCGFYLCGSVVLGALLNGLATGLWMLIVGRMLLVRLNCVREASVTWNLKFDGEMIIQKRIIEIMNKNKRVMIV